MDARCAPQGVSTLIRWISGSALASGLAFVSHSTTRDTTWMYIEEPQNVWIKAIDRMLPPTPEWTAPEGTVTRPER
jgi:hypothetical protein